MMDICFSFTYTSETLSTSQYPVEACYDCNDCIYGAHICKKCQYYVSVTRHENNSRQLRDKSKWDNKRTNEVVEVKHTIHIPCSHRFRIRERVHDQREQCPCEQDVIRHETERTHPEGPRYNILASTNEQTDYRNGVAEVEQDDTCCYHAWGIVSKF